MQENKAHRIFCIMGKSGSGKDTLYKKLLSDGELPFERLVSCTTRPIRAGEQNGREYRFYSVDAFRALEQAGKVIESRCYETVHGPWYYFTADDGRLDLEKHDYLGIGTLVSYEKIRDYFGPEAVIPLYITVESYTRLLRALNREKAQEKPSYTELCRRFLADEEDFSPERLAAAGITDSYSNDGGLDACVKAVRDTILAGKEHHGQEGI